MEKRILNIVLALLLSSILVGNVKAQELPVTDQTHLGHYGITRESGQSYWRSRTIATLDVQAGTAPGQATLVSPSATISTSTPTYTWDAVANATWYYLWVNDSTGNRINMWYTAAQAGCPDGSGTCSAWTETALAAGSAEWWIQTWNDFGYGPWSDVMDFTLVGPGQAALISPSGAIATTTPTYTWNADPHSTWYYLWVTDCTGNKIRQWYTAAAASCAGGSGTCTVTPPTAAVGSGKWWIQTWNPNGYGPWSAGMEFTTPTSPPPSATLLSPAEAVSVRTPTYTWNAVPNSTWYYLWVNDRTGTRIQEWYTAAEAGCPDGTGTCSATPDTSLALGAATWWVETYSTCACGPWSSGLEFTVSLAPCTVPPAAATLISPSGTVGFVTPGFSWSAVEDATQYRLWVDDVSATGKIQKWYTASDSGCPDGTGTCTVNPGVALNPGNAAWWIRTKNDCGDGPWSAQMNIDVQVTQGQTSFVLTWGQYPSDLDAHLFTPSINGQSYHVWYPSIFRGSNTSPPYARLDVDSYEGYGPETMTIYQLFTGTYQYYVHNYSGEDTGDGMIAGSGAQVKIFGPTGILLSTVNAPGSEAGTGYYWHVADLDGATGIVTIINEITDSMPTLLGLLNLY